MGLKIAKKSRVWLMQEDMFVEIKIGYDYAIFYT